VHVLRRPRAKKATTRRAGPARRVADRLDDVRRFFARPVSGIDAWDLLIVAGVANFFVGVWMFSPRVAFAAIGAVFFVMGVAGALNRARAELLADADRRRG
jgi:hypothetical protein